MPMPFQNGFFVPQLVTDPRARAILLGVAPGGGVINPSDFLMSALRLNDTRIKSVMRGAVQSGSLEEMIEGFPITELPADPITKKSRQHFSPEALRALDEFAAVLRGSGGLLNPVAPELLLHFVLVHMEPSGRESLANLDIGKAAGLFREAVGLAMTAASAPELEKPTTPTADCPEMPGEPILLPRAIAPSEDLTWRARQSVGDKTLTFKNELMYQEIFENMARGMHRRQDPHVLLTGERGVGKAAVVAEFARLAAGGHIPFLSACHFLMADGRHIPPDETRPRLAALLAHIAGREDLVVCLDGFARLLRGDRGSNKPAMLEALSDCQCRIIGLLTPQEYEEVVADDPEFGELFTRVDVPEPDQDTALRLTAQFARGLETRYGIGIDPDAIRQAVVLSAGYVLNDQFPAKAVRVLTQACERIDYDRRQLARPGPVLTADHIVRIVSELSGVPAETLCGVAGQTDYEQGLRDVIFGQDHAIREVAAELGLIKAGMTNATKPASVMLFLGQTGTGKTEMAKALARFYSASKRLKTYTLGNCVEPHSVATIIGVPPGYVGNDRGGRLVNELNADPYGVVLLDEADKAHPDVLQPFLNLFDEGWVTDQRGVKAFGTKAIFILTTNVGQRMISEMAREGKSVDEITSRMKEALSQIRHGKSDRPVFTPEFLARIKRIIVFKPLDGDAMRAIADKRLREISRNWREERRKELTWPEALGHYVGRAAHRLDRQSGGREGGRVVHKLTAEWVESPLQRAVSQEPASYRQASRVVLTFSAPEDPSDDKPYSMPAVQISFQ